MNVICAANRKPYTGSFKFSAVHTYVTAMLTYITHMIFDIFALS